MNTLIARFAVLQHDHPELHWDLMLERGQTLWTWRLSAPLTDRTPVPAERIADHRPMYLDYEGPVSNNRGSVARWDHGTYEVRSEEPLRIALLGAKCVGDLIFADGAVLFESSP